MATSWKTRLVTVMATGAAVAGLTTVSTATPASAFNCHKPVNSVTKICQNGFTAGDWTPGTQFIQVVNAYYSTKWFYISNSQGFYLVSAEGGERMTFDRATYSVQIQVPGSQLTPR